MGNGCRRILTKAENKTCSQQAKNILENKKAIRKLSNINLKPGNSVNLYSVFQYKNTNYNIGNILLFTYHDTINNQFIVLDNEYNESIRYNNFKDNGVAIGYSKGNKIDYFIQDKFFVLFDGKIQIYCLIDGHGPYGNIVAQIIQDKIFQVFYFDQHYYFLILNYLSRKLLK